jgi:hypothetical protein
MAPEQKKDDIVCAFHGDLDKKLDIIEHKIDVMQDSIDDMRLWRAEIKGSAKTVAAIISLVVSVVVLIVKDIIWGK